MRRPTDQGQAGSGRRAIGRTATAIAAALVLPATGAGTTVASAAAAGRAAASAAAHGPAGRTATAGGSLRAWGLNTFGQLGDGTTTSSDTPVKVKLPPGTRVTSMRAGCDHSLALTTTGHVLAWGYNNDGELGDSTTTNSDTPVKVKLPAGTKVTLTAAGEEHSLARTSTGRVLAWGDNTAGALGDGTTTSSLTPVRVKLPTGTKVRALFAGCLQSLARTAKGHVLAWGDNGTGELGDGTTTSSDTPVRVKLPTGTKVTAVAAGCVHNLALTAKGHVLAWGLNSDGELGDGTTTNSDLPIRVELPAGLVAIGIAAGPEADHSMAIVRKAKR